MDVTDERARQLPWFDAASGLSVGILVLALHGPIAQLDQLPEPVVFWMGVANTAYAGFGTALGLLRRAWLARLLVAANAAWAVVCVVILVRYGGEVSVFGWLHVGGEGLYVLVLAAVEWRYRDAMIAPATAAAT